MPRLKVTRPDKSRTEYQFGEHEVTIGRAEDNLVVVDDAVTSRYHALIELVDGRWRLRDLGSSNGTFQNGSRIQELPLSDRSTFEIGGLKFRFLASPDESPNRTESPSVDASSKTNARHKSKAKKTEEPSGREVQIALTAPAVPLRETNVPADVPRELLPGDIHFEVSSQKPSRCLDRNGSGIEAICHEVGKTSFGNRQQRLTDRRWRWVGLFLVVAGGSYFGWEALHVDGAKSLLTPSGTESGALVQPRPKNVPEPPIPANNAEVLEMREPMPAPIPIEAVSTAALSMIQGKTEAPTTSRRLLYSPPEADMGFMPVLSSQLNHVLHLKKAAGHGGEIDLLDVFLDDRRLVGSVRVVSESQMRFAEQGSRWAVLVQDEKGLSSIVLQDRKYQVKGEVIQWVGNRDFSHLAFVTRLDGEDSLYIDGKRVSSYHRIRDACMSDDGSKWACIASKPASVGVLRPAGERVVTHEGPMEICDQVSHLTIAQAGGRVAWVANGQDGRQQVMTAGKHVFEIPAGSGREVQKLAMSDDGQRLAWTVVAGDGDPVLHVAGEGVWPLPVASTKDDSPDSPFPLPATRILFSKDGRRVVAAAAGRTAVVMPVGGRETHHGTLALDSLTLSDDGRKLAFVAFRLSEGQRRAKLSSDTAELWVDGVIYTTQPCAWWRASSNTPAILVGGISSVRFSPDGGQLAYFRSSHLPPSDGGGRQVWVGQKPLTEQNEFPEKLAWIKLDKLAIAGVHQNDSVIWQILHKTPR